MIIKKLTDQSWEGIEATVFDTGRVYLILADPAQVSHTILEHAMKCLDRLGIKAVYGFGMAEDFTIYELEKTNELT